MTQPKSHLPTVEGVQVLAPFSAAQAEILTAPALTFVRDLNRGLRDQVDALLARREERKARFDRGELPDFRADTAHIRAADWKVAPLPADLLDRRVEITGPVERKMVINALNSGARMFMADFEDSNAPTFANCIEGQVNLRDAVAGTITFEQPGKPLYQLKANTATLLVRPRGWHMEERHVLIDGRPAVAGLFDFGLYLFHNHAALAAKGSGPYFYLPKMESSEEAALWNTAFERGQDALGMKRGTIKATVLIETLPAAFELDEILHALREHSAGLNCGRWDYIFSYLKTVRAHADRLLPDRIQVGMTQPFMAAYAKRVVQVCHRRGVHAMGGMAAQIPIKNDPAANEAALGKVRTDKEREAKNGHDGTWVAHPGLVPIALAAFDAVLTGPNQIDVIPEGEVTAADLLAPPTGTRSEEGLRHNIRVGVQYIEAWLGGNGCVPLYNLMEDAATAEISRTQVWQWVKHRATLEDGSVVTADRVKGLLTEELAALREAIGPATFDAGRFDAAGDLFLKLATGEKLIDFLTLPAYEQLLTLA